MPVNHPIASIRNRPGALRPSRASLPYRSFMQITGLEMERSRILIEREAAVRRLEVIAQRLEEIDRRKAMLLGQVLEFEQSAVEPQSHSAVAAASGRGADGRTLARVFKY